MVGHNPGKDQSLVVIQIWNRIQEFFGRNLTTVILAIFKDPLCGFGNNPKLCRLMDLRFNKSKPALAEVCVLQMLPHVVPNEIQFCRGSSSILSIDMRCCCYNSAHGK